MIFADRNINFKKFLQNINLFLLVLFALSFFSCKDDPVTVIEEEFDPPRYDWEIDTLPYLAYGIWAADTDFVCVMGSGSMAIYDGDKFNYQPYNFLVIGNNTITGIDRNNIYIGGLDVSPGNLYKPKLTKWNGSFFEEYIVSDTADGKSKIISTIALQTNDVWLGTGNGRAFHFNGVNFKNYNFDTNLAIVPFFRDNSNNVYFCATRYFGSFFNPDSHYVEIRKFSNDTWNIVYSKILSKTEYAYIPRNVMNGMYSLIDHEINEFNGSGFTRVLESNSFEFMFEAAGNSINDFISWGTDGSTATLYSWNGFKWANENISIYTPETDITIKHNVYFATANDFGYTLFYKGEKKGGSYKLTQSK